MSRGSTRHHLSIQPSLYNEWLRREDDELRHLDPQAFCQFFDENPEFLAALKGHYVDEPLSSETRDQIIRLWRAWKALADLTF